MKKKIIIVIVVLILLSIVTTIYFSTDARINRVINKLPETKEIVVRGWESGKIVDEEAIEEIISILSNYTPPNCRIFGHKTASGSDLGMDMLNEQGEIIATINIWTPINQMMPQSIKHYCGRARIDVESLNRVIERTLELDSQS